MNNTELTSADFTHSLPPPLKNDPNMLAIARAVAEQLRQTAQQIRKNVIYARIDELDEQTLDVLAYDLHVDWYDYSYPVEVKRQTIKDSVKIHRKLGTKYAVETALGAVFPDSEIEEWFEYNGTPHTFRVVLDMTNSHVPADYFSIEKAVHFYKRLSAHMENMIYQCRVDVQILADSDKYQHLAGYSGRRLAGTYPRRNTLAALTDAGVALMPDGGGVRFASPAAGTKPRRSTAGAVQRTQIAAGIAADAYLYTSRETGVQPHRSTTAEEKQGGIIPEVTGTAYTYRVKRCGTDRCKDR